MSPATLVERIERVDWAAASAGAVTSTLGDLGRLKGWVAAQEAQAARRATELESSGSEMPAADALSRASKSSRRDAEKAQRRGAALGHTPGLEGELAKGRISTEHADALANAAGRLDSDDQRAALFGLDETLAANATTQSPAQFSRSLAKLVDTIAADDGVDRSERQRKLAKLSHGLDQATGMGWIRADLHPDDYQKVKRRLDAEVNATKRLAGNADVRAEQLAATALVDLVTGGRATAAPPAQVNVIIDHETLVSGLHDASIIEYSDGSALPVETVRRHACDAKIIPTVLNGAGMPLDVGRGARHATTAQRAALRAMYRGCAVDGCERDFDRCEMHHIIEWGHDGDTDLANLVPLCSHHHHRVHEGRWRLQLEASSRELSVFLPDGTLHTRSRPDIVEERAA